MSLKQGRDLSDTTYCCLRQLKTKTLFHHPLNSGDTTFQCPLILDKGYNIRRKHGLLLLGPGPYKSSPRRRIFPTGDIQTPRMVIIVTRIAQAYEVVRRIQIDLGAGETRLLPDMMSFQSLG